jgi:hypothetical protein
MNTGNPDHISESLETIFLGLKLKTFKILWCRSGVRDKHPGFATLVIYNKKQKGVRKLAIGEG